MSRGRGTAALALAAGLAWGCAGTRWSPPGGVTLAEEEAWLEKGEYLKVLERLPLERIDRLPRRLRARAYALLGQSQERLGRYDQALLTLQFAEGLFPKSLDILCDLAGILHRVGLDDRARPYYLRVLKIHPNNAVSNVGVAEIYQKQGLLAKAQEHFERAMLEEGWSRDPGILRSYSEVLAERGDLPGAMKAIRGAMAIRGTPEDRVVLARIERRQGAGADGYEQLDLAVAAAPERAEFRLEKALWLLEDGRDEESLALVAPMLAQDPANAVGLWIRGSVFLRRGETARAREDFAAGSASGSDPFAAAVCRSLAEQLASRP